MNVHVFRCSSNPNLFGFTKDAKGSNLPADRCSGAWDYFKEMRNVVHGQSLVGVDADTLLSDLKQDGYHLGGAEVVTG